ncbi:MAG: chromosomal replication initiator protein DnaA [Planctomycetota bacterium]|nr:MAG: chromosomal replication initiator protein DnaA [Planctomycetota bacterium]
MTSSTSDNPVEVRILDELRATIPPDQWAPWFEEVEIYNGAGRITFQVPSPLHSTFLQHRFQGIIENCTRKVLGSDSPFRVVFEVKEATSRQLPGKNSSTPDALIAQQKNARLALKKSLTFEAFVTGPSNQLAHAAAMAVADNPGGSYNPFFLHGSVGLGKTHLLQAVGHRLQSAGIPNVIALSCASFTNEFIAALSSKKIDEFRTKYRKAGALLIDDIQFLCDKERTQEEFFHTFNEIYNQERQIFLTSDAAPSTIRGLSERLVSRFRLGLVVQLDPPDLETRMAIVHRKADQRGLELPNAVVEVVARRVRDNVRELEGAVLRIESMARHENRAITTNSVSDTLDELLGGSSTRIDLRKIEELVSVEFSVSSEEMHSKRRTRSIVLPRQVCMYLGRRLTDCSLGEIGHHFGGRDHSTVLHSIEKIRQCVEQDNQLRVSIEVMENRLRQG